MADLENSTFQKRPAYRYIRKTDKLPTYEQLGDKPMTEIMCRVKLFNPTGTGTWWIAAYSPEDRVAWGVAELQEREVGSFSMAELVEYRGRFGLPMERDLWFKPTSIAELIK